MPKLPAHAQVGHPRICSEQPRIVKRLTLPAAIFFRLLDFFAILAIPLFGSFFRQTTENLQRNLCFWTLLAILTVMLIASHGGYRVPPAQGFTKQTGQAINCFLATSFALLAVAVLLGHAHILLRRWTLADLIITPFVIACARAVLAGNFAAQRDGRSTDGPLVVCYDHYPADLTSALRQSQIPNRISGILYLSSAPPKGEPRICPTLPDIQTLLETLHANNVQDVVFVHHPALDELASHLHQELLSNLLAYPARIWLAFDVTPNLPAIVKNRSGGCQIVPIVTDDLVTSLNMTKRVFDLAGSAILLLAFTPLLLMAAVLVKASGPGPIIFRQIRTGAHGRQFTVLKFRTMTHDPNRRLVQASRYDPRVTTIGRLLRRTSLDELLQLFNVIRGEMSLVGPRPHAPETEVEGINFESAVRLYRLRHRVKPGITGLAQVRGLRGETPVISMLEQRLASDLEYIQSWSLWLDLSIILQTVPILIAQTNAW